MFKKLLVTVCFAVITSLLPCCCMKILAHEGEDHGDSHNSSVWTSDFLVGKWTITNKNFVIDEHESDNEDEHDDENNSHDDLSVQKQSVIKFHAGHDHLPASKKKVFATMFFCTDDEENLYGVIEQKKLVDAKKNLIVNSFAIDHEDMVFALTLKPKSSLKFDKQVVEHDVINLQFIYPSDDENLLYASFDSGENYYELNRKNSKVNKDCRKVIKQIQKKNK